MRGVGWLGEGVSEGVVLERACVEEVVEVVVEVATEHPVEEVVEGATDEFVQEVLEEVEEVLEYDDEENWEPEGEELVSLTPKYQTAPKIEPPFISSLMSTRKSLERGHPTTTPPLQSRP